MSSLVRGSSGGKMHLISMASKGGTVRIFCQVVQVVRVDTSIVESYESNEWTQALSSRQRILPSGKMHLIRETGPKQSVVESYKSYEWTQALSSRQRMLSSGKMHLIRETGAQAISCRVVRVVRVDTRSFELAYS